MSEKPPKSKYKKAKSGALEKRVAPEVERVRAEVAAIASHGRPLLVGPYTSEVGFELLYWIPFLRWAASEFPELLGRLTVVSRGGVSSWYEGLADDYVDLFAVSTPDELLRRRLSLKQPQLTEYERDIADRVGADLGGSRFDLLHPSLLFSFYYRAVKADSLAFARSVRAAGERIDGLASVFQSIRSFDAGAVAASLPEDYVAVRFYFRPSFPDTDQNRRFAAGVVAAVARQAPVVLLNTELELDDHHDFSPEDEHRVIRLSELGSPEHNLRLQTAVVGGARAFVGTYGGLAYLAPFLGVPSLAFSSAPEHTHPWHLELAQRVFAHPGWGRLVVLRPDDMALVELATGALAVGTREPLRS